MAIPIVAFKSEALHHLFLLVVPLFCLSKTNNNFSFQGGRTEDWDWERNKGDARSTTHDPNLHKHSSGRKPKGLNTKLFVCVQKLQIFFLSLAMQPNFNQSLTQWRPECKNRRRNSRLCRWNTFCIGSLCGCFIKGFMDLPEDFKVWKLDLRNEEKFTTIYFSRETLTWLKARWV